MFSNVGGKIKIVAQVFAIVGIIASVIVGIMLTSIVENLIFFFLVGGCGSLVSWISALFIYGYGQLIENSDRLVVLQPSGKGLSVSELRTRLKN